MGEIWGRYGLISVIIGGYWKEMGGYGQILVDMGGKVWVYGWVWGVVW